jgi:hypothetical protein
MGLTVQMMVTFWVLTSCSDHTIFHFGATYCPHCEANELNQGTGFSLGKLLKPLILSLMPKKVSSLFPTQPSLLRQYYLT